MDFTYLFAALQGRINRAKWWAGEAILFLVFSITSLIGNQTMVGRAISALIWIQQSAASPKHMPYVC